MFGYESLTIGPFHFRFYPDGDDPDTGIFEVETKSGYRCRTSVGVPRDEWEQLKTTKKSG